MKTKASSPPPVPVGPVVVDSSAVLAFIRREKGMDVVAPLLPNAFLSTVNYVEIVEKLCELGVPAGEASVLVTGLELRITDFTRPHADVAADLKKKTRSLGLSLGDRACLALALTGQMTAVTADRAWADPAVPATVFLIR